MMRMSVPCVAVALLLFVRGASAFVAQPLATPALARGARQPRGGAEGAEAAEGRQPFAGALRSAALVGAAAVAGAAVAASRAGARHTSLRYTTQQILPSFVWLKTGFSNKDLAPGDFSVVCLAGCDVCVGKTSSGKAFCIGDKAPPTGISFSAGASVEGDVLVEQQYGNSFNVFTGEPVGEWCPSPPLIGPAVGAFMGGPQAVAVFEVREAFLSGDIEVLIDTNAKRAYEADYWKGLLDAQGKDDGSYY